MVKDNILIVEDDAIIAMDIESRLKKLGYGVSGTVIYAEKAIEKVEEHKPDLVLMDIVLKGEMDGIEAAEIIRSRFGVPVIFLTAHADEKRLERAKLTTPFGFILKPFRDEDLKVTIEMALYVVKVDAERKQAEEALLESEEKYRRIFENELMAICIFDLETMRFIDVNDAYVTMYGYSRAELLANMTSHDITVEHQASDQASQKARVDGTIYISLRYHKKKSGEVFPVEIVGGPYRFKGRSVMFAMARDISARIKAEEEMSLFKAIIEKSGEAIAISDHRGQLWYINPAHEKLFGYSLAEARQLNYRDYYPPESITVLNEVVTPALAAGKGWEGELEVFDASGRRFALWERADSLMGIDGAFQYGFGLMHDITERKQLEEKLQQSQKIEALGTLVGGIAHEFNNVLGIIIGNTELALDDVPESNPAHFNLDEIKTASLRAKDVVRQLLNYIREIDYKRNPIKIIPVVKDSIKFLRASMPSTIEIQHNIEATADTILADPTQTYQIMINLGTNASHAMEETGGFLNIGMQNVVLDEDIPSIDPDLNLGSYVKVTVSDTGPGIDPEIIDRIFDPFFTTKEVGKGAGLGLSVVHGIVKSYGGAITVDSELGKGTTFTAYFPIIEEEAVIESKPVEKQPTGNERILFVDDEESIVSMGTQRLERLGYKVESTTSPLEALDLFRSKPDKFDLVITDLTMPKMTGDKLVKEILNIRPDMPIIICTGFSQKMDGEKAMAIGAAGFLAKPHENRELAMTVKKVLGEK